MRVCPHCGEFILKSKGRCLKCGNIFYTGPFDGLRFKEALEELFPSIYLTLLSLIQSFAFSALAYNLYNIYSDIVAGKIPPLKILTILIYAVLTLFIIILIWYDYLYNNIFKRYPNFQDVLYPLLFGMFEGGLAVSLERPVNWILFVLLIGIVAGLAYGNTLIQFKESDEYKKKVYGQGYDLALKKFITGLQWKKIILVGFMFVINALTLSAHLFLNFPRGATLNFLAILPDMFLFFGFFPLLVISFNSTYRFFKYAHQLKEGSNL